MKKTLFFLILSILTISISANDVYSISSNSRFISKYDTETEELILNFAEIGLYANRLTSTEDYLYLVASGDNAIQKFDKSSGELISEIITGDSSNPYDCEIKDGFLYVVGLFTNKLYKIDLSSEEIVGELEIGTSPQDIHIYNKTLFTANTGVVYPDYNQSSVSVVNLETFELTTEIDVELNTQKVFSYNGKLHAVSTGNYSDVPGKVVIIDIENLEIENTLELGGMPGNAELTSDGIVYLGDAYGAGFYVYNAETLEVYDSFGSGGAALAIDNENIYCGNALDWVENSTLTIYNYDQEELTQIEIGVGIVDIYVDSFVDVPNNENIEITEFSSTAYPNPFNLNNSRNELTIKFESADLINNAVVNIFNLKGQLINELEMNNSITTWNGKSISGENCNSGIYFYQIKKENKILETKPITLIK